MKASSLTSYRLIGRPVGSRREINAGTFTDSRFDFAGRLEILEVPRRLLHRARLADLQ